MLENKIPPPIVGLSFGVLMWQIAAYTPQIATDTTTRWILSGLLVLLGFGFAIAGGLAFRKASTTVNPLKPEEATSLVIVGVYKISRNPMYVGMALLLLAWVTFLAAPWALLGVVGFILYINRFQIAPEERALVELFGQDFKNYKSTVRRWL